MLCTTYKNLLPMKYVFAIYGSQNNFFYAFPTADVQSCRFFYGLEVLLMLLCLVFLHYVIKDFFSCLISYKNVIPP